MTKSLLEERKSKKNKYSSRESSPTPSLSREQSSSRQQQQILNTSSLSPRNISSKTRITTSSSPNISSQTRISSLSSSSQLQNKAHISRNNSFDSNYAVIGDGA